MKRASVLVLAVLALALVAAPALGAPLFAFKARIQEAAQAASDLRRWAANPGTAHEDIAAIEARLRELVPEREIVTTDEGDFEVDNTWLGERLAAFDAARTSEERERIAAEIGGRLSAIRDHLDAYASARGASEDERAKLREILGRREFRDPSDDPLRKLARTVRDFVVDVITWIRDALFGGSRGTAVAYGVRSLVIVAGVIALALLARFLWRRATRRDADREVVGRTVLGERVGPRETAATLADAARALASRGDYRAAIRKLYVAQLYALAERKMLRLSDETTNHEYLAQVRALAGLYPVLAAMTDMFERVWYGAETPTADEWAAFERLHGEALERAGAGASTAMV